jgi:hypothetical protein
MLSSKPTNVKQARLCIRVSMMLHALDSTETPKFLSLACSAVSDSLNIIPVDDIKDPTAMVDILQPLLDHCTTPLRAVESLLSGVYRCKRRVESAGLSWGYTLSKELLSRLSQFQWDSLEEAETYLGCIIIAVQIESNPRTRWTEWEQLTHALDEIIKRPPFQTHYIQEKCIRAEAAVKAMMERHLAATTWEALANGIPLEDARRMLGF